MLIHNIRGLDHIDDLIEDKMREQLKTALIEKAAKLQAASSDAQAPQYLVPDPQTVKEIKDFVNGSTMA